MYSLRLSPSNNQQRIIAGSGEEKIIAEASPDKVGLSYSYKTEDSLPRGMLETHMNSARTQTPLRIPWSRRSLVTRGREERLLTSRMVKSSLLGKYLQRTNNIEDTVSI